MCTILTFQESLDYIGSDRMLYDMNTKNFPVALDEKNENQSSLLGLENIGFFLELNQIGLPTDRKNYFAHIDPQVYKEKTKEVQQHTYFILCWVCKKGVFTLLPI